MSTASTVGSTASSFQAGRESVLAEGAVPGGAAPSPAAFPAAAAASASAPAPDDDTTTDEGDQDSSLRSLLCEETIPGSPAPQAESAADAVAPDKAPGSAAAADAGRVVEMPFASAPNR